MEDLLDLLMELEDAGVADVVRAGKTVVVVHNSKLSIVTPLSTRRRLAIEAYRPVPLGMLRKIAGAVARAASF